MRTSKVLPAPDAQQAAEAIMRMVEAWIRVGPTAKTKPLLEDDIYRCLHEGFGRR